MGAAHLEPAGRPNAGPQSVRAASKDPDGGGATDSKTTRSGGTFYVGQVKVHLRKGIYHADYWQDGRRRRPSLRTSKRKEAQEKAQHIHNQLIAGDVPGGKEKAMRIAFQDFLDIFRQTHTGWSESTWQGAHSALGILADQWAGRQLQDIQPVDFETFRVALLRRGRSESTTNRYLSYAKTIMNAAVTWGYLEESPLRRVKKLREQQRIPSPLSDEEVCLILKALPPYARTVAVVAIDTGMRAGELFRLDWRDVDFSTRRITVQRSKSGQFRVVHMTDRVHCALAEQRRLGVIPHVLCGPSGERLKSLSDVLARCSREAGISHVHMHRFRHTTGFRLRRKGVGVERIAAFLGHKTLAMGLRYARADPEELVEGARLLGEYEDGSDDVASLVG